jgi:hypothetical protein
VKCEAENAAFYAKNPYERLQSVGVVFSDVNVRVRKRFKTTIAKSCVNIETLYGHPGVRKV